MNKLWKYYKSGSLEKAKECNWELEQINQQDDNGQTLLMIATIDNNKDWVKFLLSIGADEDIVDNHGYKAITLAAKFGLDKIMIYFLKTGAGG